MEESYSEDDEEDVRSNKEWLDTSPNIQRGQGLRSLNHEECPVNRETDACILRELVIPRVKAKYYPDLKIDAIER